MKQILVVDDNEDILDLILMILEMEGFDAEGLSSGAQLTEKLKTTVPDLILLDVLLGDSDGRKLCHDIKSTATTANVPVIMISASHAAYSLPQAYCQPNDFIPKPFDVDDLVKTVKRILQVS